MRLEEGKNMLFLFTIGTQNFQEISQVQFMETLIHVLTEN